MTLGAESALGSAVSRRSSRPRALALGAVAARRARARVDERLTTHLLAHRATRTEANARVGMVEDAR